MIVPASSRLFGLPTWAIEQEWDLAFLGVPSSHGMLGLTSAAGAPGAIRAMSAAYPAALDDMGKTVGWWDYATGEPMLAKLRICDAGDFKIDRSRGSEQFDELIPDVRKISSTTKTTVLIGGDHSISFWIAQTIPDLVCIIIDAHEDSTVISGTYPHHGNFVSYMENLEPQVPIFQLGLRGLVPNRRREPASHRTICRNVDHLIDALRAYHGRPVYISLDVDILDPSILPHVASPCPYGWSEQEVLRVFQILKLAKCDIRLVDICEFAPIGETSRMATLLLVNFLLHAAEAVRA